jgi:hypothetical protein
MESNFRCNGRGQLERESEVRDVFGGEEESRGRERKERESEEYIGNG